MQDNSFIELILPEGITEFFEIKSFKKGDSYYSIYLEEKNIPPREHSSEKLMSKGFFDEITLQDFPIRGKASYLNIKRRRWQNTQTGMYVVRDWNLVAKGTKLTQEFASFLKEVARYQTNKRQ
jgi:hypothetical protein